MRVSVAASSFAVLLALATTGEAAPVNTGTTSKTVEPSIAVRPPKRQRDSAKQKNEKEPVQFGFLAGVGFPRPIGAEVLLKIADTVTLGGEYSVMPATTVGAVTVGYRAYAFDLRIHPLKGAFFIGAKLLRQHLDSNGTVTNTTTGTSYSGSMTVDTWFVNPRMGLLWTWSSGFSLGMDAGLQIPMSHTESLSVPALPPGTELPSSVTSVPDTFGKKVLPTVTLLQLGLLF